MPRPKIAAVITEYRPGAHAQHILDRLLWGYPWQGCHRQPEVDLVALYTDQVPESDLSRHRAGLFSDMRIYPTIHGALTLGSDQLAVDGVLLIGEHGQYPQNEKGQTLWPRYEFFRQIVEVFRASGRCVPVFNDKHLSWNWAWAREMVDTAAEMGFPFMAGSSLPWAARFPSVEMPWEAEIEEALCIAPGGPDGYDIHALEAAQCMLERRRGGETGAVGIQALADDAVWVAVAKGSWAAGAWDRTLFETCLYRSHTLAPAREAATPIVQDRARVPAHVDHRPIAYRYEYADGTRATILLLEGLIHDFTFAAKLKGQSEPLSTLMYLPPDGNFFIPFTHAIEQFLLTARAPFPIERNLLTTGLTAAGVGSLHQGQQWLATPHLDMQYQAPRSSLFWRQ